MATAALLKPGVKVLQAIKDYTVKIDSETISDYPLKATLIYEAIQKYGVSVAILAEILGKTPQAVQAYLDQRIDPNLYINQSGRSYFEIDRAKVERQIRSQKEILKLTYSGGMNDDWYVKDMAIKIADRGIGDLKDFGETHSELLIPIGTKLGYVSNGDFYFTDDGFRIDKNEESKIIRKSTFDEEQRITVEYGITTETIVVNTGHIGYINKKNPDGFAFWIGVPHVWENACEGNGCTNYMVQFTTTGIPVFSTQWYDTGFFVDLKPFLPIIGAITALVGLPLLLGDAILGAVGATVEGTALSTAIGKITIDTVLTGGDIGAALTKDIIGSAGSFVGDFVGTGVDSASFGKIAGVAATAVIGGKNPLNAAAFAAATLGIKMLGDDTFVDTTAIDWTTVDTGRWFDTNTEFASLTLDELGINLDADLLTDSLAENEAILAMVGIETNTILPDLDGNLYTVDGYYVELNEDTYIGSIYVDDNGNVRGPDNEIIIPAANAVKMTETEITEKIVTKMKDDEGKVKNSEDAPKSRPAAIPPAAAQTKSPTLADQASTFDKVLKTAVSIGASIKAITNGTFRPTYQTSAFGTPRVQTPGVPIRQSDGSVITNNGNGTQTIRYPNGQTTTTSTNYSGSGILGGTFAGIPTSTLLIGGGVLLAALLLTRK